MIQIGMNCDPEWLCDAITGFIAVLLALLTIGLIRISLRERRKSSKKYVIKPSDRAANRNDQ
ncbi:hypothetical protein [Saccharospirillum impatiens]|uniref:hypothetical protein n=1 Tax=Saccharospirillum impatiens TaxID=169438 RepID=UPI000417A7A0|nr:hypothetical protein [Saccharospirillum impatiens]